MFHVKKILCLSLSTMVGRRVPYVFFKSQGLHCLREFLLYRRQTTVVTVWKAGRRQKKIVFIYFLGFYGLSAVYTDLIFSSLLSKLEMSLPFKIPYQEKGSSQDAFGTFKNICPHILPPVSPWRQGQSQSIQTSLCRNTLPEFRPVPDKATLKAMRPNLTEAQQ